MIKGHYSHSEYHHQFIAALQQDDPDAFTYFQSSYMVPLVLILQSATGNFPESFQIMLQTFERARCHISEYSDDQHRTLFMWLFEQMMQYLNETPCKKPLHQRLEVLMKQMRPPY